jgi:outer membrane protein assembly factor BamB
MSNIAWEWALYPAVVMALCSCADWDRHRLIPFPETPVVPTAPAPPSNAAPANPASPRDVITQRYNNLRTGATIERGFNQASVSDGRFGLLRKLPVDGHVLSQPLYMESVPFERGRRSALFVATSTNWIYAFDANTFEQLWARQISPPYRIDDPWTKNTRGNKQCPEIMVNTEQDDRSPKKFVVMGIESTPVIDPKSNRMIVSYRSAAGAPGGMQRIAAIDIRTGATLVDPQGLPLDREVTSNPIWNRLHRGRASLLLDDGFVFVSFSARCENHNAELGFDKSYQGWIYSFDAHTLAFAGRYRTTESPSGAPAGDPSNDSVDGGGIWQASTGPAADGKGNVYFGTGNAYRTSLPPDANGKNLSSSVVRLHVMERQSSRPGSRAVTLEAADWFTPYRKVWQDSVDLDLGSGGVMLIPNTHYLVQGGKEGILYLLDRNNLGKFDDTPPFVRGSVEKKTTADPLGRDDSARDHAIQKLHAGINQYCESRKISRFCSSPSQPPTTPTTGVSMDDWIAWPHIHGTPVFGAFPDGSAFMYVWPEKDHLKSFRWEGKRFDPVTTVATVLPDHRLAALAPPYVQDEVIAIGMPGGMLSLSIDPGQPAGGVLFASVQRCRSSGTDPTHQECSLHLCDQPANCSEQRYGMLRAFDPVTLRELWNNQVDPFAGVADKNYWFAKFVPPTIAHGKVFLATGSNSVLVYGRH